MKKLLASFLILISAAHAAAQTDAMVQKYKHQLELVDSVRSYIQNTLHLNTGNDFYQKWSTHKDSMYYYVYVSAANNVESYPSNPLGFFIYDIEDSALSSANKFTGQGYQTLIYKTSGTADAELTPKLLSYPDEAIAFIMVHEAVHRHISGMQMQTRYPYIYEECLCDAMANIACVEMAKKPKLLRPEAAFNQQKLFEEAYAFVNRQRKKLDAASNGAKPGIFKTTTLHIAELMQTGNQFQKDRMIYEVNNAYFLRNQSYATHYFEVKRMIKNGMSLTSVVSNIYQKHKPAK